MPLDAEFGIQMQFAYHIAHQNARLHDLYFVVNPRGVGHKSQVHHISEQLRSIAVLFPLVFYQHAGRQFVGWLSVSQIQNGSTHEDNK